MSTISSVSGPTNLPYVQPATNAIQPVRGGDSDGDSDGSSGAGKVGKSSFINAIEQALGQSLSGSSTTSAPASASDVTSAASSPQNPQAALQGFLHSLFSALSNNDSAPASAVRGYEREGSNLTSKIQDLLKQLGNQNTSGSGSTADAIGNLSSSFKSLLDVINSSQGSSGSGSTTQGSNLILQSVLQNLLQNLSGDISGAVINTQA